MDQFDMEESAREITDDIDLADMMLVVWRQKLLFSMIVIICVAIAVAIGFLSTPIYRAEVLVFYETEEAKNSLALRSGAFAGLAGLVGFGGASNDTDDVAIATMQSKKFLMRFIDDYNLMPVLFDEIWDSSAKRWNVKSVEDVPNDWDAYDLFRETILEVLVDAETGLITVAVEWKAPKTASEWANELVRRLNEQMRSEKVAESEKNLDYLYDQLGEMTVMEIRDSIYQLIEEEIKSAMLARNRDEFAFNVIDPATPTVLPIRPRKTLLAFAGGVLGGMLGLVVVFIRRSHRLRSSNPI